MKQKILFLCTGNSCRSQMAEGWMRFYHTNRFEVYSAGIEKHGLNPYAVQVMKENGVDISTHYSKTLDEIPEKNFDIVVTVCKHADEHCPVFRGKTKKIHQGFEDPPKLALLCFSEEEKLNCYRSVCTKIQNFIKNFQR